MTRNSGGREYDPTRISPRLPLRPRPSGSRWRRALCSWLGHDPVVVWPKAHCRRCRQSWGSGDPYP